MSAVTKDHVSAGGVWEKYSRKNPPLLYRKNLSTVVGGSSGNIFREGHRPPTTSVCFFNKIPTCFYNKIPTHSLFLQQNPLFYNNTRTVSTRIQPFCRTSILYKVVAGERGKIESQSSHVEFDVLLTETNIVVYLPVVKVKLLQLLELL